MSAKLLSITGERLTVALLALACLSNCLPQVHGSRILSKRGADHHHGSSLHSHMSRKVFDRACAAPNDTINEIIKCMTTNEFMLKTISPELAANCYQSAYNQPFDFKDFAKHKEIVCKERDKFEDMTSCIYKKTTESMGDKEKDKLAEAMVDVGLCILNALEA